MKRILLFFLASVGGLVLFGFLFLLALTWALVPRADSRVPSGVVLELDLTRGVVEAPGDDPFTLAFERSRPSLRTLVSALHRAADDDRVAALHVVGGSGVGGWALTQEVRDAVLHFRASGKPTLLFAETFGELAPAQGAYYLASAFDEVILQPSGDLGLAGLSLEAPFFRGVLDRWEIVPRFEARGEFKDAVEILEGRGFSPPVRAALEALLRSLEDDLVEGIAEGRGLAPDSVRALLAAGPFSPREGLEAGLVDALGYRDDARARMEDAPRLSLLAYADRAGGAWDRGERIALVQGSGAIQRGGSPGFDPLGGGAAMAANAVARAIREAADDRRTRAIILRVDSPGGSYVASDLIRREVIRAREKEIPVVVSMANAAASGGYLISADADRIVAHPGTLTGSIGVVAGRLEVQAFLEGLGVTFDEITLGNDHGFYALGRALTPADSLWLARQVDRIYDDFVGIVAQGRNMTPEAVDAVARGRVWSGRDALDAGLVDALGGYPEALALARELAGIEADAPVELRRFPQERTLFQLVLEGFSGGPDAQGGTPPAGGGGALAETLRGAVVLLRSLGRDGGAAPVRTEMPPLRIPGS